ncbi:MAG: hypothetical protein AB7Q69_08085 [Gemmatimonadales bacterium]
MPRRPKRNPTPALEDEEISLDLASAPLDSIILPLLAPLAPLVLEVLADDEGFEAELRELKADRALVKRDPHLSAPATFAAVMRLGEFAVGAGPFLFAAAAAGWMNLDMTRPLSARARIFRKWLGEGQPGPAIAAVGAVTAAGEQGDSIHLPVKRPAREIAHGLYHHVRSLGVVDWPGAHAAARRYWGRGRNREILLLEAIRTRQRFIDYLIDDFGWVPGWKPEPGVDPLPPPPRAAEPGLGFYLRLERMDPKDGDEVPEAPKPEPE